jgi:hypothetical protein
MPAGGNATFLAILSPALTSAFCVKAANLQQLFGKNT